MTSSIISFNSQFVKHQKINPPHKPANKSTHKSSATKKKVISVKANRAIGSASSPELQRVLKAVEKFDREKVAKPTMSHNIAAHFLSGSFIQDLHVDSQALEGSSWSTMAAYFLHTLKEVEHSEKLTKDKDVAFLKKSVRQLLCVQAAINEIQSLYPDPQQWGKRAHLFAQWMIHRITQMKPGEQFMIPGGWLGKRSPGHAMIYHFIKQRNGRYTMSIYNTGAGIPYHLRSGSKVLPLTKKELSLKSLQRKEVWQAYYEMTHESLRDPKSPDKPLIDEELTEKQVYQWLKSIHDHFAHEGAEESLATPLRPNDFHSQQKSNTCAFESLWLLGKQSKTFLRIKEKIRKKALSAYEAYLVKEGYLPEKAQGKTIPLAARVPDTYDEVMKNQGIIDFFHECVKRLAKETLKEIRKRPDEISSKRRRERSEWLKDLEARIKIQREACNAKLKMLLALKPLELDKSLLPLPAPKRLAKIPGGVFAGAPPPLQCPPTQWPAENEFSVRLKKWCDFITDNAAVSHSYLSAIFSQIPSVDDPYWENVKDREAVMVMLSRLVDALVKARSSSTGSFEADLHHFHMEKILAILLKLSQSDPILNKVIIDLQWLPGESQSNREYYPMLFASDPKMDKEIVATRAFLTGYRQQKGKKKVSLEITKAITANINYLRTVILIKNGNEFSSISEADAIWEHLQADNGYKKKEIEEEIVKECPGLAGKTLPNSLILAYAMLYGVSMSDAYGLPTPGLCLVKRHIFHMLRQLYGKQRSFPQMRLFPTLAEHAANPGRDTFRIFNDLGERGDPWYTQWASTLGIKGTKERFFSQTEKEVLQCQDEELRGLYSLCSQGMNSEKEGSFDENAIDRPVRAIEFFTKYNNLLDDPQNQSILSSCLFHPGLLRAQLESNPQFARKLAQFIRRSYANTRKDRIETALFLLRLSAKLDLYCRDSLAGQPILKKIAFPSLWDELAELQQQIEDDEEISPEKRIVLQSLMAREALAFLGRGEAPIQQLAVKPILLKNLIQYQLFLGDHAVPDTHKNLILDELVKKGRFALIGFLQQSEKDPALIKAVSQFLTEIVGFKPKGKEKIVWDYSTLPVIEGSVIRKGKKKAEKKYTLHLHMGTVFIDGRRTSDEPPAWIPTWHKGAQYGRFQEEIGPPKVCYFSLDGRERCYVVNADGSDDEFIKYNGHWCQSYHELPPAILSATKGSHPFLNKNKICFLSQKTSQLTHIYDFAEQKLTCVKDGLELVDMEQPTYKLFTNFDRYAHAWKTAGGVVKRIDFPTYQLQFEIDGTGQLLGTGDFAGMCIAEQQMIKTLTGISGTLVLEHKITKERRVLMALRKPGAKTDFTKQVPFYPHVIGRTKKYALFNVVGNRDLLEPTRQETRIQEQLHLVMIYLSQHKYAQAHRILEQDIVSPRPYTIEEKEMLLSIVYNEYNFHAAKAPEASAIRLKAAALFAINERQGMPKPSKKWQQPAKQVGEYWYTYARGERYAKHPTLAKEWALYSQHIGRLPEFLRISAKEEQVLGEKMKVVGDPDKLDQRELLSAEHYIWPRKNSFSASSNFWYFCRSAKQAPSLDILDTTVFSSNLEREEMGEAFLSFYAICCDPSTDSTSIERKARLNVLLENLYGATDSVVGRCSGLLQMILQGKIAKDKVPSLRGMQKLIKEAEIDQRQQKKLDAFCALADVYVAKDGFPYALPFQRPSKEKNPSTPVTGYEPILRQQPVALPWPIIGEITQAQVFTQTSKGTTTPREPINEEFAKEKAEQNAFATLRESAEQYVKELEEGREWHIEESKLLELETILTENIERHRPLLSQKQRALRTLANTYPTLSPLAIEYTLKQQAGLKEKIDWRHLQLLYIQGNALAYKELNPLLDEDMVQKIYGDTEQLLLDATQQKQRIRALDLIQTIKKSKSSQERSELVQKFHHEISSKRAYCPSKHPEILVYEYRRDLQLRESQVKQIETLMDQNQDRVLEIIMGGGKSDILLPLLALKLADGKKLSMLILPEELIDVITPMMHIRARGIFRQTANRLDWDTSLDLGATGYQGINALYTNLKKIIEGHEVLLVTADDLHQFALAARNAREQHVIAKDVRPGQKILYHWFKDRLETFRKIHRLLKTSGYAIVDEVDSQLRTDLQILRALGIPRRIPKEYCDATTILFDVLAKSKKIQSRVYLEFSKTHKKTAQPYVEKQHKTFLIEHLAEGFLQSPKIEQLHLSFKKKDYRTVKQYLINPPEKGFLLPKHFDQRTKDTLAIVRNQLHVIFPITLGKIYGENYGHMPVKKKGGEPKSPLAIPYGGALKPRPRSQFASYQEQISYTLQSYLKKGVSGEQLKPHLEKMRSQMLAEITRNALSPEQTRAHGQYVRLVGKHLTKKYPLETMRPKQFQELADELSKKSSLIRRFVNLCILPSIKSYPGYISSNGKNLVDMLHRVHGVSGTVERDKDSLSSRFEVTTDPTIRGKTLICSEKVEKPLLLKNNQKPLELLKEMLEKAAVHKEIQDKIVRALIDRGALFKDIPAIDIAKTILEWGMTQIPPIQAVIYYDKNKKLTLEQGKTETQFYNADLDKDPSTRFTYYPQPQTIGADVPQAFNAAAIMTLNKNTDFQQAEQGGWRMRGLDKEQCLLFAVPEDAAMLIADKAKKLPEELTSSDLLSYTVQREVRTQMNNNPKAIYQMLDNAFLNQCEAIFDSVEIGEWQQPAYEELHRFTTVKVEDRPYEQLGQGVTMKEAGQVLHEHRRALMDKFRNWYVTHGDIVKRHLGAQWHEILDIDALDKEMRQIIDRSIDPERPIVPENLMTKQNNGQETEVELEQETEQETEAEKENEQENQREVNLAIRDFKSWVAPTPWIEPSKIFFKKDYFTSQAITHIDQLAEARRDPKYCPILSVADTLLLDEEGASNFQKQAKAFFDPKLTISFNAVSSSGRIPLFRGNQRPLGSALLIQDRKNPKDVRLMLLSFDEEKTLLNYLRQDQRNPFTSPAKRRYRLALFSPQMHTSYGDGIYAEGSLPIHRDGLLAKNPEDALTVFERLIVQSKVAMGETRSYSPRELRYIDKKLQKHNLPPEEFGKLFEKIFQPGLVQAYANSTLESLFKAAKTSAA